MKKTNTIHFLRIIIYLIMVALTVWMYVFLQSHLVLIILVLMAVLPLASVISVYYLKKRLEFDMDCPVLNVRKGEGCYLKLSVKNPLVIPSMNVTAFLKVSNNFYKSTNELSVAIPANLRGEYMMDVPINLTLNGNVTFCAEGIKISDFVGFVEVYKPVTISREINIFPENTNEVTVNPTDYGYGMSETDESRKKGNDYAEVSEVREYIPGDKLMNIHWKLSAKRDILMVKDRESMSDEKMVLLIDVSGTYRTVDKVIDVSYGLCKELISGNTVVKMIWLCEKTGELNEEDIVAIDELDGAFSRLYYDSINNAEGRSVELMRFVKPEVRAYIRVGADTIENESETGTFYEIVMQD